MQLNIYFNCFIQQFRQINLFLQLEILETCNETFVIEKNVHLINN